MDITTPRRAAEYVGLWVAHGGGMNALRFARAATDIANVAKSYTEYGHRIAAEECWAAVSVLAAASLEAEHAEKSRAAGGR